MNKIKYNNTILLTKSEIPNILHFCINIIQYLIIGSIILTWNKKEGKHKINIFLSRNYVELGTQIYQI